MSSTTTLPPKTPWTRVFPIGIFISVIVAVVVMAFIWPTVTSTAHNVPVSITGPDAVVSQVKTALAEKTDALDLQVVDSSGEAVDSVRDRSAYGAIILSADNAPEVIKATAGSPAVAQVLSTLATTMQEQSQQAADAAAEKAGVTAPTVTVKVVDVAPLSKNDPTGAGLAAAAFPLVMGGMLGGIVLSFLVHGVGRRVLGLVVYSVAGGLVIPAILQGWFGVLEGNYFLNAAAFALALSSMASVIVGTATLAGRAGIAVGPVLFLLFANPISSAATPVEYLPSPWGAIGQWFPPGAGARLLRNLSYFPDANSAPQWVALGAWTALGLTLLAIGAVVHRRRAAAAAQVGTTPIEDPLTV